MPNEPRRLADIAPGTSLLPIPFSLSLFACLLFAVTLALDFAAFHGAFALPVWLSIGNIDDARSLLSALLGAVSTVLDLFGQPAGLFGGSNPIWPASYASFPA
jgi:hypothetical protein